MTKMIKYLAVLLYSNTSIYCSAGYDIILSFVIFYPDIGTPEMRARVSKEQNFKMLYDIWVRYYSEDDDTTNKRKNLQKKIHCLRMMYYFKWQE